MNRNNFLDIDFFGCEYQPIICANTQEIFAYEALARFRSNGKSISPNLIFEELHKYPQYFFNLESLMKKFQISHRPENLPLFVNLDPHVCAIKEDLAHWLSFFQRQENLVVEIIENTTTNNLANVIQFMRELGKYGGQLALDDFGSPGRMFSLDMLEYINYLKLDMHWLNSIARSDAYKLLLKGLIEFAKSKHIPCIFEGIETREKFQLAVQMGADYVQGFLFKDQFMQVQSKCRLEFAPTVIRRIDRWA